MLLSINQLWEITGRDRKTITKKLENLTFTDGDKGAHLYESSQALPLIFFGNRLGPTRGDSLRNSTPEKSRIAASQAEGVRALGKANRG